MARAKSIPEIFELVKQAVAKCTGRQRAGLMLGMANLGGGLDGLVGAFYPVETNIIVMNSLPLARLRANEPELYNPYVFHILLHEYLHSLGTIDEGATRRLVVRITSEVLGGDHPATALAKDLSKFVPKLVYPVVGWRPEKEFTIDLVEGFDISSTEPYIR